ncbi:MAG: hypothetical protein QXI32_04145 [Candidatus Bathyarchaeia archaeon]
MPFKCYIFEELSEGDSNLIVLPQFIFEEDVGTYKEFRRLCTAQKICSDPLKKEFILTTYTSANPVPRLMPSEFIVRIVEKLNKVSYARVKLLVYGNVFRKINSDCVVYKGVVPRAEFLAGVASSDLYIERNLDEELGFSTLEAGLLGVPIAKVTLPSRTGYFDVPEDAIINVSSIRGLFREISRFIVSCEKCRSEYASNFLDYLLQNRMWSNVKYELLNSFRK